jgi:hypothetical protein
MAPYRWWSHKMSASGRFRPIEQVLPAGSCPLRPQSVPLWLRVVGASGQARLKLVESND